MAENQLKPTVNNVCGRVMQGFVYTCPQKRCPVNAKADSVHPGETVLVTRVPLSPQARS